MTRKLKRRVLIKKMLKKKRYVELNASLNTLGDGTEQTKILESVYIRISVGELLIEIEFAQGKEGGGKDTAGL